MRSEVIFLLDRSGSMSGREQQTIDGYNRFLAEHADGDCRVTTVLFDDSYQVLYDGVPAGRAVLTRRSYWVRGSTALYDAIGRAIMTVGTRHSRMKAKERPRTFLVILTDGLENASREYSAARVRQMLDRQRRKHGWEVLFFGCDVDAALSARELDLPAADVCSLSDEDGDYFQDLLCILNRRL